MTNQLNNRRPPVRYGSREGVKEDAKLPKTIAHWFREYGVTFDHHTGTGYGVRRSLKSGCASAVRHFRALPHIGVMQICDGYFDRWANSVGAEVNLPKSRAEFVAAMEFLLASGELAKIDVATEITSLQNDLLNIDDEIREVRFENRGLEAYVAAFGLTHRLIRKLWGRHQRLLSGLTHRRRSCARELKYRRSPMVDV